MEEDKILRFNQSLKQCLKVSVRNDLYHFNIYDKIQINDTTIIKYPNTGGFIVQNWLIK